MITEYLNRLSQQTQNRVQTIEDAIGFEIEIKINNHQSPTGETNEKLGSLSCEVSANNAFIFIPYANYFPEFSVFHELLHIERFLVKGIPQLQLNIDFDDWNPKLERVLTDLDNQIEHLLIVPEELSHYPERRQYWIDIMERTLEKLSGVAHQEKIIYGGVSWAFVSNVLADEDLSVKFKSALSKIGVEVQAKTLADQLTNINIAKNQWQKLVSVF